MTGSELVNLRLDQFEQWRTDAASTIRSVERDVDIAKIESATIKGLLIELRTDVKNQDEYTRASLARLHARLDEITTAESFEQGREAGIRDVSGKTWKVVGWTVTASTAFMGVVVAALALILH